MSSGGKGGSQQSSVEIPPWAEAAMQRNIARAENLAQVGNQVYYGPQVAAFNPTQIAAMDSANAAASAFGLGAPTGSVADSLPTPTDFGNGLLGYETGTMTDNAFAEWAGRNPQAAAMYNQEFAPRNTGVAGQGFPNLQAMAQPTGDPSMYAPPSSINDPLGGKGGAGGLGGPGMFNTEQR